MRTLGILGGGQLARMTVLAAHNLGIRAVSLDSDPQSPAAQVGESITGSIYEHASIAKIMEIADAVVLENEFVPAQELERAMERTNFSESNLMPGLSGLANIQDKLIQRRCYDRASVPSPVALPAGEAESLGFPCILKSCRGGYDGKGTQFVADLAEYEALRPEFEARPWLAEAFVDFEQEISVMVVRTRTGELFTFSPMVTEQVNHVCDLVYPVRDPAIIAKAREIAKAAVVAVDAYGLVGAELFLLKDGSMMVNELAPRPHNSGHYTMNHGGTSQFDAHILSAFGALSGIEPGQEACMANLLGQPNAGDAVRAILGAAAKHPDAHFHWYGKATSKPGRKMGHLNTVGPDAKARAEAARETFYRLWVNR